MIKILEVIGKQDELSDCSFIIDEGVMKYQQRIQATFRLNSNKLSEIYFKSNSMLVQLLREMLQFNPYYRPTAKECLQHKIFDHIRVAGLESNAPFKINIDADRNEYKFDYE
jgi:serine/threonine protein kinase